MQVGKVYFVHLREQEQTVDGLQFKNNSGITFAWKVEQDGRVVIGKPAVCFPTDIFVKAEGRRVAQDNLDNVDAYLVIPSEHTTSLATAQTIAAMNFSEALTPKARLSLFNFMVEALDADVAGVMTTRWFEGLIRARFHNVGGHLRQSLEQAEFMEYQQIIASGLYHNQLEDAVLTVSTQ